MRSPSIYLTCFHLAPARIALYSVANKLNGLKKQTQMDSSLIYFEQPLKKTHANENLEEKSLSRSTSEDVFFEEAKSSGIESVPSRFINF